MDNVTNGASDAFMEVALKKMESQDRKLLDLEKQLTNGSDHSEKIQRLIESVQELKTAFNQGQLPGKIQELSARLTLALTLLQKPLENKVNHHHHVPKLIWITAGLFILLSLVCSGWYMTAEKLDGFIANDTKYRLLKLDTVNIRLLNHLYLVDSLYQVSPGVRDSVIQTEERNRRNLEMLQMARDLEREAGEMKRKVYNSK